MTPVFRKFFVIFIAGALFSACGSKQLRRVYEFGNASFYGPGFDGNRTANGEIFDQAAMTAAHKTLPFDSRVKVTDMRTGNSVVVRINDRGPFIAGRIIDLSQGAADDLGILQDGVAPVQLVVLD